MSSNPANTAPAAPTQPTDPKAKSKRITAPATPAATLEKAKSKRTTRQQLAAQAAAALAQNPEPDAQTANNRKLRDTMAAKNGRVAENILRERTLETGITQAGGIVTDGLNAQARLNHLRIPVDAAGRSPSSLVAIAGSSPLTDQERFSIRHGPPQTPTRMPANLSTVPQLLDPPNRVQRPPALPAGASSTSVPVQSNPSSTLNIAERTLAPTSSALITTFSESSARSPVLLPTTPTPPTSTTTQARLPPLSMVFGELPGPPPEQLNNVPVRIELGQTRDFGNPLGTLITQYVTVPKVSFSNGGYTCQLSDVMGRLAQTQSPIKSRSFKVFRLGPEQELVALGRGNDLSNPNDTRLADNPFLNTHHLERTDINGTSIFTGVKIYYEHQPTVERARQGLDQHESDEQEEAEAEEPHPTPPTHPKRPIAGPPRSRDKRRRQARVEFDIEDEVDEGPAPSPFEGPSPFEASTPFDPNLELYPFLRSVCKLDPDHLPGQWDIRTARDALDRYRAVQQGEEFVAKISWRIPNILVPIPESIRGRRVNKTDLQSIYGFSGDTTWWTLSNRWSKKALKGALVVQAWVKDPDATMTVENGDRAEEELYPHLNALPFNKLKGIIELDRKGRYSPSGPKSESSSDSPQPRRSRGRRMVTLNDFNRIAEHFPGTASIDHVLSVFGTCLAVKPLLRLDRAQNTNREETAWYRSARTEVTSALEATEGFYQEGEEALMPDEEDKQQFLESLRDILDLLPRARRALSAGIQIKPLLLTKRTTCIWCKNPGNMPGYKPLQRRRQDIDITLITGSYRKVQARLSVGHCYTCKADYYPDRVVKKENGELRQFFIDDTPYLRISKSAKLWVERSIAIAQEQMILQHQTFSGYAAWFNKTYGPNGFCQAIIPDAEDYPSLTDEQSYRMFVEHMVRLLGQTHVDLAPETTPCFNTPFDPTTEILVEDANEWFVTSQRGIIPGSLLHTCKDCTHVKRYRHNIDQDGHNHGVAEQPNDGEDIQIQDQPIENQDQDVLMAFDDLPNVQRPNALANGDGEKIVRLAVMDGKVAGHAIKFLIPHISFATPPQLSHAEMLHLTSSKLDSAMSIPHITGCVALLDVIALLLKDPKYAMLQHIKISIKSGLLGLQELQSTLSAGPKNGVHSKMTAITNILSCHKHHFQQCQHFQQVTLQSQKMEMSVTHSRLPGLTVSKP
ncbi:hypothetical protein FRB90_011180 [Tulasnella sp. 427]|nr:hypothetical protein FRB90_011180 [Tulasnella sp. 427]